MESRGKRGANSQSSLGKPFWSTVQWCSDTGCTWPAWLWGSSWWLTLSVICWSRVWLQRARANLKSVWKCWSNDKKKFVGEQSPLTPWSCHSEWWKNERSHWTESIWGQFWQPLFDCSGTNPTMLQLFTSKLGH